MGSIAALKRTAVEQLLAEEDYFLIVINPLVSGIKLPARLIEARQPVPIHLGHRMAVRIPDLVIDDAGISGTLAFGERSFACAFPWPSVIQVSVGDEHLVWVVPSADAEPDHPTAEGAGRAAKRHLRLV